MAQKRHYYITTPIYYVTAKPHLGTLYTTVLADVFARWQRMRGADVFFLTGSDEHGQKIAHAAARAQVTPQAFVDSFVDDFKQVWSSYGIDYTRFIRTTDADHIHAVNAWIGTVRDRGDIYQGSYEGYYCTPCESFVLDRESAQEGSGAVMCTSCGRETALITEPCYFFRLSKYQEPLLEWYASHPDVIMPAERLPEVIAFLKSGLNDLAISRSKKAVSWGIPFPGDESQVVYVWVDALMNYMSAVGYGDEQRAKEYQQWWPADMHIIGKDIVRFHAIFWPAFLMAAGCALPKRLLVHGWLKVGDAKMSKSLGNVVDPRALRDQFGAEEIRYYLTRYLAVSHDAPFLLDDVVTRLNADLSNDLGNLLQRLTALAHARMRTTVVISSTLSEAEVHLYRGLEAVIKDSMREVDACMLHRAYARLWHGIAVINSYVHAQEPWRLAADNHHELDRILGHAAHTLSVMALLAWPVMPTKIDELLASLGTSYEAMRAMVFQGDTISMPAGSGVTIRFMNREKPLFPRIEVVPVGVVPEPESALKAVVSAVSNRPVVAEETGKGLSMTDITIDELMRVALVVGTISAVDTVPKSDKLYRLTIDLGSFGVRTICSGVRKHFEPELLMGSQVIVVANLASRMMMGIASQGMVLFAEDASGGLILVRPVHAVPNGTRLR
jgi:methionyl-tRNA synthetase